MATAATAATAAKPLINLLRGWPHRSMLAAAQLSAATARVLASPELMEDSLQYGPDPGYQPLRERLAAYLGARFGGSDSASGSADPERICITGGASQSMANLLLSFSDPVYTAAIWICAPCYHLACPIFDDAGFAGRLRAVPEDAEGIDVVQLEAGFSSIDSTSTSPSTSTSTPPPLKQHLSPERKAYRHIVYVVPTSSNPSGRTMTLARRQALVRLARRYDALIVADDVYDLLQWPLSAPRDGDLGDLSDPSASASASVDLLPTLPRLVDVDRALPWASADEEQRCSTFGNAISNGSFSKLVGPGVRTGWVEAATPAFAYGLAQTGNSKSGGAPSQLCAAALAEMLQSGDLERHLSDIVRPTLQRRHRRLAAAIDRHLRDHVTIESYDPSSLSSLSSLSSAPSFGGYFVWLRLRRPEIRASDLASRAMALENLVVPPGSMFRVKGDNSGSQFEQFLRICYAYEDENKLVEGIERLARVLRDWDTQTIRPSDGGFATDEFK